MKYFSIETVVNAYKGFQDCMTNKSWGYLAILKGCKSSICPSVPFEVDMDMVSNFLENIFNLSQTKKRYESGRTLYVVFSNKWDHYFNYQGKYSPNLFDIIVWAYRRKAFNDDITKEKLFQLFSDEFNIPIGVISDCFNVESKEILFVNTLYSESDLKTKLNQVGVNVSSNNIDAKKASVVASPGEISRGPFVQTLYAGLDITDYVLILQSDYYSLYGERKDISYNDNEDTKILQQIFYGAPGTGKSHKIKDNVDVKVADEKNLVFRTTFHPDSDYSTFVGAYKPTMKSSERIYSPEELTVKLKEIKTTGTTYPCHKFAAKYWESLKDLTPDSIKQILNACGFTDNYSVEIGKGVAIGQEYLNNPEDGKIIYSFCPQAFTNAYVEAWNTEDEVYLVIEEINRGNCAQIFGDLFQLLDRKNGVSEYPVEADVDLQSYLNNALAKTSRTDIPEDVKSGKKLMLPSNLYIWATMNTSDQSLFPIDSAFKRRWEWKYIKIKEGKDENGNKLDWKVDVKMDEAGTLLSWWDFIKKINEIIASMTSSADKQLGYFFCKANEKGEITTETFVSKVLFYLWNDVFKDYGFEDVSLFKFKKKEEDKEDENLTFPDFYDDDGDIVPKVVIQFIEHVMAWKIDDKKLKD